MDTSGEKNTLEIQLPSPYRNTRQSDLPEPYDDWELPEVQRRSHIRRMIAQLHLPESHEHWDLPEVCDPSVAHSTASDSRKDLQSARKSYWRRNWVIIVVLLCLLVAGGLGGGIAAVVLGKNRSQSSYADSTTTSTPTSTYSDGLSSVPETAEASISSSTATSSSTDTEAVTQTTTTPISTTPPVSEISKAPTTERGTASITTSQSQRSSTFPTGTTTGTELRTSTSTVPVAPPTRPVSLGRATRGDEHQFAVAFHPDEPCSYVKTANAGVNPCDKPWELNGTSYVISFCGSEVVDMTLSWKSGSTLNLLGSCPYDRPNVSNKTTCGDLDIWPGFICQKK
ncbi:hypothetical protein QBC35DRAFT_130490 [Podospora australis]|uniref:Uncharacterized protein n=1 Tax=Podospora australis TaxID=1536484 RepID=A0AAN6WMM4_9PEZI|nr:hypothetical protein QBC35DRAFT_130490 [Podospora australis]